MIVGIIALILGIIYIIWFISSINSIKNAMDKVIRRLDNANEAIRRLEKLSDNISNKKEQAVKTIFPPRRTNPSTTQNFPIFPPRRTALSPALI